MVKAVLRASVCRAIRVLDASRPRRARQLHVRTSEIVCRLGTATDAIVLLVIRASIANQVRDEALFLFYLFFYFLYFFFKYLISNVLSFLYVNLKTKNKKH